MNQKNITNIASIFLFALLLLAGAFFIPWNRVNWGKLQLQPSATITVSGYADKQEMNEIASFTAGVRAVNQDKQTAVDEVNTKIEAIIQAVKNFGIEDKDIQTQNNSIYQRENFETGETEWEASNNIQIKLNDASRANDLADLLASTEATNVYGPNFSREATSDSGADLMAAAIEDARKKAEAAATASGKKLGEVVSVTEGTTGGSVTPLLRSAEMGLGGGAALEPGSSTVRQTVTVIFELK